MRALCGLAFAAIALLLVVGPARGQEAPPAAPKKAEYYVSPGGDDANPGTSAEKAFKTIGTAAGLAQAGDTVNIAPGKYVERVKIARSGTPDAPITLRGYGKGEIVWTTPEPDPKRFQDQYALTIEGQQHIVVEGLTFRDCRAWIVLWESSHCTVRNCTFDGVRIYNALRINSGSFNRILDCRFVRSLEMTGFREESNWIPVPGCDYIEIFRDSHNNLVQGCEFGKITHTAVSVSAVEPEKFCPSRNIVRGNVFRDPFWKCLWFHAGKNNLFENNLCLGSAANFIQLEGGASIIRRNRFLHYRDSTGGKPEIELRGVIRIQYNEAQHNRIYANLFYDNERTLTNNSYRWNVTDNIFKNNIFFQNGQTIFLGFPDYTTKNRNMFLSNVLLQKASGEKIIRLDKDTYTLAEAQEKLRDLYRGNLEVDPLLDLKDKDVVGLKAGSPCIDTGAALTTTPSDGQGTEVGVEDPLYFCDGWGLIEGDRVAVGANPPARLLKVDYDKRILRLDREISWKKGDPVNLPYEGRGPDIGPYEFAAK